MNVVARNAMIGAGLGAGLMFMLDPAQGNRRRALMRDKMIRAARKTRDAGGATGRDLRNRVQGLSARARSWFRDDTADDGVLEERVRAELGRISSHPGAICVDACDGCVTLTGDVLASEAPSIVTAIEHVRGVSEVVNEMTTHSSAEHIPALQGESARPGQWSMRSMVLAGAVTTFAAAVALRVGRAS